jgi:hypothetical protein
MAAGRSSDLPAMELTRTIRDQGRRNLIYVNPSGRRRTWPVRLRSQSTSFELPACRLWLDLACRRRGARLQHGASDWPPGVGYRVQADNDHGGVGEATS